MQSRATPVIRKSLPQSLLLLRLEFIESLTGRNLCMMDLLSLKQATSSRLEVVPQGERMGEFARYETGSNGAGLTPPHWLRCRTITMRRAEKVGLRQL